MNIWKRILLWTLNILGFGLTFVAPLVTSYFKIFSMVPMKTVINVVWVSVLGIFILVYFKYLKKRIHERLNARATVEEFGIQGATNPIIIRLIKALELLLPMAVLGGLFYILTFIPSKEIIAAVLWLTGFLGAGQILFGIADYFKWIFMIDVEAKRRFKVEQKMDKIRKKHEVIVEIEED